MWRLRALTRVTWSDFEALRDVGGLLVCAQLTTLATGIVGAGELCLCELYPDVEWNESVAKLEAALDLESSAFGLGGSTPPAPTKYVNGELAQWSKAPHC